jgi:uncharacterized membrane protein YoaT (DUF817 family)
MDRIQKRGAKGGAAIMLEFVWQESLCCLFAFAVLGLLFLSRLVQVPGIPRYDLIFLMCLAIQFVMIKSRMETPDEAKTIAMFHVIGLGLELFKVNAGSWSYPEAGYLKIGGVPLFSGFMYASVGSYVVQAWKRLDLKMSHWPSNRAVIIAAALTYGNFFTNHYMADFRWPIIGLLCWIFRKVWVSFRIADWRGRMPLLSSFICIGSFVWVAENIGTRLHAWEYPYQAKGWTHVDFGKLSSWSLLVIITVILVAQLKKVKHDLTEQQAGQPLRPALESE